MSCSRCKNCKFGNHNIGSDHKKGKNISKDELLLAFKKKYNEKQEQYILTEKNYNNYKNIQAELNLVIQ